METFTDDAGVWEVSMVGKRKVMKLVEPVKRRPLLRRKQPRRRRASKHG